MEQNALLQLFFDKYKRLPTVEEAEDFVNQLVLVNQPMSEDDDDGQTLELRARQVEQILDGQAYAVDVQAIYDLFNHQIAGMKLDALVQESVYFWRVGEHIYADNLDCLEKIS